MKICCRKDCKFAGIPQPIENFDKNPKIKSGRCGHCRSCANAYKAKWEKKWRKEHLEEARARDRAYLRSEQHRAWYLRRRDELNALAKEWRKAHPKHVKDLSIKKRFRQYGVTPEWYEETLRLQGGKCAICGSFDPKSNGKTFHVDHDHSCCGNSCHACDKCRRGLLCAVCNTRLGILEDTDWIKQATAYLARYK